MAKKTKNSNSNFDTIEDHRGIIKTRSGLMKVDKTVQFMDAFYRNGGNITDAAMDVFNCSTRASAAQIGRKYLENARKRGLIASFMENANISYGDLIGHAYEKMKESKNPAWWDRLMREAGYLKQADKVASNTKNPTVNINVGQAHNALVDDFIQTEEEYEFEDAELETDDEEN